MVLLVLNQLSTSKKLQRAGCEKTDHRRGSAGFVLVREHVIGQGIQNSLSNDLIYAIQIILLNYWHRIPDRMLSPSSCNHRPCMHRTWLSDEANFAKVLKLREKRHANNKN